jgi:hypothetical protein
MLKQLKEILNSYTEEQLENMEMWVNSNDTVNKFVVDDNESIDLITSNFIYKVIEEENK